MNWARERRPQDRPSNQSEGALALRGRSQRPGLHLPPWAARTSSPPRSTPRAVDVSTCPPTNWCMGGRAAAAHHTQQGTVYVFANVYMYPEVPGRDGQAEEYQRSDTARQSGRFPIPIRLVRWQRFTTAGGLVFYGSLGGDFRAVDREPGASGVVQKLGSGSSATRSPTRSRQAIRLGLRRNRGWIGLPITAVPRP